MKILFIAPTPFFADRGCHVRILEEARALGRLGHEVTIVTYHIGNDVNDVRICRIPPWLFWYKKLSAGPSVWKLLLDILLLAKAIWLSAMQSFDVIHGHLHEGCLIGYLVARLRFHRLPLIFDVQGKLAGELVEHSWLPTDGPAYRAACRIERLIMHLADVTVASNVSVRDYALNMAKMDPAKVHLVLDGVDIEVFKPQPKARVLLQRLGIPDDSIVLVYLGLLTPYQGVDILLQAFQKVARRDSRVRLLLMGYPNEEYYRQKAVELGIDDLIIMTGRIDYATAPALLSLGDIAVSAKLPGSGEGNGKLYNYLAMGLPVVAFDVPVNREILGNCVAYPANVSVDALSEAIEDLIRDPARRARLGREGRARAAALLSWTKQAEILEEIYRAIL